ncbi:hypothetical protein [Pseudomonas fluorescens]|uniref:hypothetical protein n=1 Tax=Pseudomonas fluorescens TaxID=294 RepID=UPI000281C91B|nr:hypothetical protein [Pseudomonas fluorescens]
MSESRSEPVVWVAGVGAVAGLGAALARRFAREGLQVAVSGRSPDKLQTQELDLRPFKEPF